MLLAWADDEAIQAKIMTLNTMEEIHQFLRGMRGVIFIIDQMNALQTVAGDNDGDKEAKSNLFGWLKRFEANCKALLSTSSNNQSFLKMQQKQTSENKMHVYGGLTTVSL